MNNDNLKCDKDTISTLVAKEVEGQDAFNQIITASELIMKEADRIFPSSTQNGKYYQFSLAALITANIIGRDANSKTAIDGHLFALIESVKAEALRIQQTGKRRGTDEPAANTVYTQSLNDMVSSRIVPAEIIDNMIKNEVDEAITRLNLVFPNEMTTSAESIRYFTLYEILAKMTIIDNKSDSDFELILKDMNNTIRKIRKVFKEDLKPTQMH